MFAHFYHYKAWEVNELTLKQFAGYLVELKEVFYYLNGMGPELARVARQAPGSTGGARPELTFSGFHQKLKSLGVQIPEGMDRSL